MSPRRPRTPRSNGIGGAPVANDATVQVAPWPSVDRFPTILGSNLSVQYYASVLRLAQNGYRQQLVDALNELIEKDAHAYSVLSQRILAVAGGRRELTPASTPPGDEKAKARALEIRDHCASRLAEIPHLSARLAALLWGGLYYGVGALEILWDRRADGWHVRGLDFIHSRRLAYPDQNRWDLHIWDQGAVQPLSWGAFPTEQFFGLSVRDWPGKFITSTPSLKGDYPTREGLGRLLGWLMIIKLMAMRGAGQYVERFGKPWAFFSYTTAPNTGAANGDRPRTAGQPDIDAANDALKALGTGSLNGAVLPDSLKVALDGPGIKGSQGSINHEKLIHLCDEQMSKAVGGGTLQADAGEKGARSLGEVHERNSLRNARYDAAGTADDLKTCLVWWLVHLDFPGEEHLCPGVVIHVEEQSPDALLERAAKMAALCGLVDAAAVADDIGVPLVDPEDPKAVRMQPLKPAAFAAMFPGAAPPPPLSTPPPKEASPADHEAPAEGEPPAPKQD